MNVADYVARFASRLGVRHLFGVGGANIEDVYDALARAPGARGVLAKHEFSAATMADGYSRATGELGVVLATSGGGALNLVPALGEAHASGVPVLALVGQPPTAAEGRGAFQDTSGLADSLDAVPLFASVSRYCRKIDRAAGFQRHLHDAVAAALSDRRGPAVLLLPKDVQQAEIDPSDPFHDVLPSLPRRTPVDESAVQRAAAMLAGPEVGRPPRVLVIAGDGVARHDARAELASIVRALDAHVAVTPDGRDVFDNHDPRFAGVVGIMGHPGVGARLDAATVCLVVGTRLPQLARMGLEPALLARRLVHVHCQPSFLDPAALAHAPVELLGDIRELLRALCALLPVRGATALPPSSQAHLPSTFLAGSLGAAMPFRATLEVLGAELPDDANVFVDAGNTGASAVHFLKAPSRGRFVVALGMGGMGYSFGAAIGAAFANGKPTYVLAGDGAFFMHGLEIHTAIEHQLPITFVLFNNNAHAMCFVREQLYYRGDYSFNRFRPSHLGAGLEAMFPTLAVPAATTPDELRAGLRDARRHGGPRVISVEVDAREVPPFAPFLLALEKKSAAPTRGLHDEDRRKQAG